MDRFQEMAIFLAVADEEGFAAAARRLNMSAPTVTRAVAALEERIGAQLLARTTRSVRLTEAGQRYLEDCRRILDELEEAEDSAAGGHVTPRGLLQLTAPVLFGELFITPVMVSYLDAHPDVSIRALLLDRVVNMVEEGIDVAIRIGALPDAGLQAVRVGSVRRVVCAAPMYLAQAGEPQHPDQLAAHRLVVSNSNSVGPEWRFVENGVPCNRRVSAQLTVSTNQAAINAASRGWGLTRVLSYQIAPQLADGRLHIVLAAFEPPPLPIHVVYSPSLKMPAKVRSFVDYCVATLQQDASLNLPVAG